MPPSKVPPKEGGRYRQRLDQDTVYFNEDRVSAWVLDDDLDTHMNQPGNDSASTSRPQRTRSTPATTSAHVNSSGFQNALQAPMLMTPPSSGRKPHQKSPHPPRVQGQNGRSASNDSRLSNIHVARPPPATSQTIRNNKVKADTLPIPNHSHPRTSPLPVTYDKRRDPNYNPMRDPDHRAHYGCDIPLPSVEDVYARQERAWRRLQRWG